MSSTLTENNNGENDNSSQQELPKKTLCEKPTEGCKLPNRNYFLKLLEDDMVKQVSVPFENCFDLVEEDNESNNNNNNNNNDDDEKEKNSKLLLPPRTKLNQVLDEFGFAIIPNLLSSKLEVETLRSLFAQDLLSILAKPPTSDADKYAQVAADPIENWPLAKLSLGHTFCSDFGLVQGRLAWHVRTNPKIYKVFRSLFAPFENPDDLCVGMDNLFFSNIPADRPIWEVEATGNAEEDEDRAFANRYGELLWPHCDQNMQELPSGSWRIFQSALYVNEVDENSSATVVWPRSHREVAEKMFYEKKFIMGHYCPIPNDLTNAFVKHCRRVPVPAGGLLIWNSRTIHQGWNSGPRCAVPVCLEPKSRRSEKALERKKKMVSKGGPSTHWASMGTPHDLGFRDKAREGDGLVALHRAHRFLFGDNLEHDPEVLPQEVKDLL